MSNKAYRSPVIGFAEKVVEHEILLSQSKDLALLKKLIALLVVIIIQEGIEYYQSINDNKYLYYKEKLDKIMINNQLLLREQRYQSPEMQADKTIRDYERKNSNVSQKIHSNLSIQNGSLSERLSIRRRTFTSGDNFNESNELSQAIDKLLKEKKIRVKAVKEKYQSVLRQDNYIMTIEQMNREVEKVEFEIEQRKKSLVSQVFSKKNN